MAHRKLAGRQFAVGLMLLVAESCSCSSRPSADLISEAGGTIEILDGARFARLEVPPGALADPLAITMRFVERRSASSGATVELLPHGAKFARPVSVTLSVDAPAAMAGRPTWVATELDSGRWELLPTSTTGRGSFTGSATHFSYFSLISPCFVAATGTQFSLPECPWRSPEVTSSERVSATINVGQVTLSISTIASTLAASTDFTIDGLLPNWTYYALTRSSPGQAPHTTDAAGRLVLRQQLATDDEVILMEHHGSFVVTPTTCSQVGQWNPATRECTLTQDIVDPPLYVPQDEITVNCADPVTGVPHVIGSSSTRASAGIYAFVTSNAPGNAVKIRNCTVRNADFGLHGALPGFTAENITITNDPTGLAGTAVTLGGGSTGASSALRGVSVDHFEVGVNSDSASGVTLEDLTIRTSGGGIVTGGNVSISRASLTAIPAVDGGLPIVGGVSLAGAGQVAVRDLRVSGYFAGLWSLSQDMLSLEGASISNSKDGVLLDSSAAAIVSNSTISQNQRGVVSRGVGVPILFHNNIHSNGLNLFSSTAIQASDTRSASPTFRQGNFWGRDCPGPLFVAGTDSNSAAVLDSFPYAAASGWLSDTPGCRSLPAPHILGPIDGALLSTAAVLFTGTVTPGAVVELLESQNVIGRESSTDDGTFRLVPDLPMTNGPHRVTARARSGSAVSTESPPLQFAIATVDTVPPRRPVIVSPTQQALLADNVVAVSGTTESMAMVTILDGASSAVTQAETRTGTLP